MNSRTRMALAMRHQLPDRVPVMCQLALGHYFLNTGIPPHEIWFTSEGFAEALVTLQRRYRFDGILINLPGRPPDLLPTVTSVEDTRDGERLTWSNGDVTIIPLGRQPYHLMADGAKPPARTSRPSTRIDLDDLDGLAGYIWGIYHVPRLAGKAGRGR